MEFKNYPKEVVSEILMHLADHESFGSLKGLKDVSRKEVAEIIREISKKLKAESEAELTGEKPSYTEHKLSQKTLALISCLSPREEMLLFKSFHLI